MKSYQNQLLQDDIKSKSLFYQGFEIKIIMMILYIIKITKSLSKVQL